MVTYLTPYVTTENITIKKNTSYNKMKKHGQTEASSFYILLSSLGIKEETVVKKEGLGIDAEFNDIKHV